MTWAVKGKGLEGSEKKTEDGNSERREGEGRRERLPLSFLLAEEHSCRIELMLPFISPF